MLEFAGLISRRGAPEDAPLAAAAVRAAAEATADGSDGGKPRSNEDILLARKARDLWRAGKTSRAKEVLVLSVLEGSALAHYYSGVIAAETAGTEEAEGKLVSSAERLPAVWAEISWRRLRAEEPGKARAALERAPAGPVAQALARLVPAAGAGPVPGGAP